ncbi:MAG: 3-phenylpropionate/cinnamic acid dioxygenase small subunit [Alphaproteobacteria bacterium]|jgi:3-phenylpropionate/cinnamic acid dioxygenase small subunit
MARKAARKKSPVRKKTPARKAATKKGKKTAKKSVKKPARKTVAKKRTVKKTVKKTAKKTVKKAPAKKKAAQKKTAKKKIVQKTVKKTATRKNAGRRANDIEPRLEANLRLRLQLEDLYANYGATLDYGKIEHWPDFFTDDCIYKLISRENYDLGLPLGTMFAEKRGGLEDRVTAVVKTSIYHERTITHLITGVRLLGESRGVITATANYAVLETLPNQYTRVLNSGRYDDKIVRKGGRLLFKEKLCIFDSALVPASIIYPI